MVREDLISSAVSFLQDPSVAGAPVDQRIAFLKSKNLTQEEIDLALQRAGSEPPISPPPQTQVQSYQRPPPQSYNQNAYWQQPPPPPPELPRRDWRDWFIMATVVGGLGFGAYTVAKRYIYPLIAPPTPPQLEQDKAAVDASFEKAFALLDQLATDTQDLKSSEQARTEKLDTALSEVESVIGQLKDASRRRDDEGRRLNDEIRGLKDMIPAAMESQKKSADQRLSDLATEMKSLKTLINNRMSAPAPRSPNPSAPTFNPTTGSAAPASSATPAAEASATESTPTPAADTKPSIPDRSSTSSPYGRSMNGRAAIPAWQLAANKKNQEAKEKSGTVETPSENATA
ncbi:peroxin 14 [Aureobasidium pullulans]|uniref:Peroxisomal membrane protein PEX14 n=1 Tax=Aureobasidium pullulans TaxID=5580 RepID=A0A4S9FF15_AURPU|nr:peroxin 14 [Aureobasidium pullulans]THX46511.1 peroxin 14 [Aureobasidium pullulans]THX80162.1 peroxin 14 [Aureobasidium pullulans]